MDRSLSVLFKDMQQPQIKESEEEKRSLKSKRAKRKRRKFSTLVGPRLISPHGTSAQCHQLNMKQKRKMPNENARMPGDK